LLDIGFEACLADDKQLRGGARRGDFADAGGAVSERIGNPSLIAYRTNYLLKPRLIVYWTTP
jgi:hypothetical protein